MAEVQVHVDELRHAIGASHPGRLGASCASMIALYVELGDYLAVSQAVSVPKEQS